MKLALISLLRDNDNGDGPIGLQSLFDEKILDHQIHLVKSLGAEKILLVSAGMPGPLLQHVDMLKRNGDDIHIVRSGSDIAGFADEEGELLFLGDGILPSQDVTEKMTGDQAEMILVAENSDQFAEFERVDLEHRWLGVAVLKLARLKDMHDIPDDWDFGSALLRTAVQAECHREVITDAQMQTGQLFALDNPDRIADYVKIRLSENSGRARNFLERFGTWPLAVWTARKLESVPSSGQYLGGAMILLGFFATITAWFEWAIPALLLLIAGQVVLKQLEAMETLSIGRHRGADLGRLGLIAIPLVLLILSARLSDPDAQIPNSVVVAALILNLIIAKFSLKSVKLDFIRPDMLLMLLIILTGAIFGQIFPGIYAGLIYVAAFLAISAMSGSAKP
ncbi:MAG: hypothetical protein AAF067_08345 [Pseudomonadota bacterium]